MSNVITNNLTLIDDAEGAIENWSDEEHGVMTVDLETEIFVQGAGCIGDRVSGTTAVGGIGWDYGTDTDLSGLVIYLWGMFSTPTVLGLKSNGGVAMRFTGATDTDYFEVYLDGVDTYSGGFKMNVVDVDTAIVSPDETGGTPPTITTINWVGLIWRTTASITGSANTAYADTYSTLAKGTAGILVEGDNAGTAWTWQDIVDASDVADASKAWGTVTEKDGVIFLNTPIQFGVSDGTDDDYFEDDVGSIVVWENNLVVDDFYGFSGVTGAETGSFIQGTKIGSGVTAVGVGGGSVTTGGPRWYLSFEDTDYDVFGLYGVTVSGCSTMEFNEDQTEILNCVFVDCSPFTISGAASIALSAVIRNTFFSACPGPEAQITWDNETSPFLGAFEDNTLSNMLWFAMEIGSGMTGDFAFEMRNNLFINNGSNRDILAVHSADTLTINGTASSLPQGSNGSWFDITMVGACSKILYTVATIHDGGPTAGDFTTRTGHPFASLSNNLINNSSSSYSIAACEGIATGTGIGTGGASDIYGDAAKLDLPLHNISVQMGWPDALDGGTASRTSFPTYQAVETAAVQGINEVTADSATDPNIVAAGGWRPWKLLENVSSFSFGHGAEPATGRDVQVIVVALDDAAGDTAVSTATMDEEDATTVALTALGTTQDDNTGGGGSSLEMTTFNLFDSACEGGSQGQGTLTIQNTVVIEVTGLNEGATVLMEATGGGDIDDGDPVGNFPLLAAVTGIAGDSFPYTNPQDVLVRARYSGSLLGYRFDDEGAWTDHTAETNSTGVQLTPGTGVELVVLASQFVRTVGSWIDEGFELGMKFRVVGTASNDGVYTAGGIGGVPLDTILFAEEVITAEGVQTDLVITGDEVMLSEVGPSTLSDQFNYWGGYEEFDRIRMDIAVPLDGTIIDWNFTFWDGAWSALTVVDGTDKMKNSGVNDITFTKPAGWAKTTVNGTDAFWVRAEQQSSSHTNQGWARKITINPTRYRPFTTTGQITTDGLSITAVWQEDTIIG